MWALVLLGGFHAFTIVRGQDFPGAWNSIGGIFMCALIAYPMLQPVRSWGIRRLWMRYWGWYFVLFFGTVYCTFVLGG